MGRGQTGGLAIIAGRGLLPQMLAQACCEDHGSCLIVHFESTPPEWAAQLPSYAARFEKLGALFDALRSNGVAHVVFAGGMERPQLDLSAFDAKTLELIPRLLPSQGAGDDETLRAVAEVFTEEGFLVEAPDTILSGLLAPTGVLGRFAPGNADQSDITRAREIARALGAVDVGQGTVVAAGLCLAVETIQGTDAMLDFVASTRLKYRSSTNDAKGVLFKGPKPGQDRRMDLPAIGPETIAAANAAGLAGIAIAADGVLMLDRKKIVQEADKAGLFVVGVPSEIV